MELSPGASARSDGKLSESRAGRIGDRCDIGVRTIAQWQVASPSAGGPRTISKDSQVILGVGGDNTLDQAASRSLSDSVDP